MNDEVGISGRDLLRHHEAERHTRAIRALTRGMKSRRPAEVGALPVPRKRGRPQATREQFWQRFREARRHCVDKGRVNPVDEEIADAMQVRSKGAVSRGISYGHLQRLLRQHGRPPE